MDPGHPQQPHSSVRAEVDELAWRELVRDQLRSLRTGMMLLGALALIALGIALWALLGNDSGNAPRDGVSEARVVALERQVADLRSNLEGTPSSAAITSLRARQQALEQRIAMLVDTVQQRYLEIQQRLDDLERQVAAPTPTPTP